MRTALLVFALAVAGVAPARAAETAVFRCDGAEGAIEAMENQYIAEPGFGDCWAHLGHHTYAMDGPYQVGAVAGSLVSVEQGFSPSHEFGGTRRVVVEGSPDGRAWTTLHVLSFRDRQEVEFSFDAGGFVARFLRIREPRSVAQGLSGFLDSSRFTAVLTPAQVDPPTELPLVEELSCATDVMEGIFAEHPCWFGGVNRYDAPSVFHTYPTAVHAPTRVSGSATFLPWRSDDYVSDGGSPTGIAGVVQTSADGATWTKVGDIAGTYGLPIAFAFDLDGAQVSFVRVVAEYHDGYTRDPALKHVRGFVVDSAVTVERLVA